MAVGGFTGFAAGFAAFDEAFGGEFFCSCALNTNFRWPGLRTIRFCPRTNVVVGFGEDYFTYGRITGSVHLPASMNGTLPPTSTVYDAPWSLENEIQSGKWGEGSRVEGYKGEIGRNV